MGRPRTRSVSVRRVDSEGDRHRPDDVIVEEPLSIRLDGTLVATTMRTPGNDYELAAGFIHAEGMLGDATVQDVRYVTEGSPFEPHFNLVTVETGGLAPEPTPRLGSTSSSCGLCGSEAIHNLVDRLAPMSVEPFEPLRLAEIADRAQEKQDLFTRTGAVHSAAVFDRLGTILSVREDIGRHNAVDKVVGRMLLDDELPAAGLGLYVSGRASFEIVQKAWAAGFGALVSVSAPSALAIETAQAAGMQLAGFVRDREINVYT